MPFQSKSQMKAAFGGFLGKEMKSKATGWAAETPNIGKLPEHKKTGKSVTPQEVMAAPRKGK